MKKKIFLGVALVFFCTDNCSTPLHQSALTFLANVGRFGDNITNYIKSKWLAHKYGIPFYFSSFPQSNFLMAHTAETRYTPAIEKRYRHKVTVYSEHDITTVTEPVIFVTNAHTHITLENGEEVFAFRDFSHDLYKKLLNDETFFQEIKLLLQPSGPMPLLDLPKDTITVAVHVRKGSGPDGPLYSQQLFDEDDNSVTSSEQASMHGMFSDKQSPKKFPPEQYYIDQIKKLSELIDHKPMYVYLFTDHRNPKVLIERFQRVIMLSNITFVSKDSSSSHDSMVNDFYNMAQFDCLIRPDSCFSYCSQLIGNHMFVFYPESACWKGKRLIIDKVGIIQNVSQ